MTDNLLEYRCGQYEMGMVNQSFPCQVLSPIRNSLNVNDIIHKNHLHIYSYIMYLVRHCLLMTEKMAIFNILICVVSARCVSLLRIVQN